MSGLYDPAFEHDSCGVGLVVRLDAGPRHEVVEQGLKVLVNLEHRGALGGDQSTGDGAGIMVGLPDAFLRRVSAEAGLTLPAAGDYAVGAVFLPRDASLAGHCRRAVERAARAQGIETLGWRELPVESGRLGQLARSTCPEMYQVFMDRGAVPADDFERRLYVARRAAEKEVAGWGDGAADFYVSSLSCRTLVYKGMLTGTQLAAFFPDLAAPDFASAFAIVHQRYSTNTLPAWKLAQPMRLVAHNGEINTLSGNVGRMRAREPLLASPLFGADIDKVRPVVVEGGSDSAQFDNVLELLVRAGRSLPHAVMMMIPEAWGARYHMSEDKRAFYEYHSAVMEPWDGPAAMVFTDGRYVGATLDRNGLRPARYTQTRDGLLVLASETGVVKVEAANILRRGRLQPGRMLLVDLVQRRVVPDNEIKSRIARRRPYRRWVRDNRIELRGLLGPGDIPREEPGALRRKQHAFGYTDEDLRTVLAPMAAHGQEPVGSMGHDAALAALAERPGPLAAHFKQLFAQVTNPAIDPLREELVMSLMSYAGRGGNLLEETPQHCRQLKLPHPILTPLDCARLRESAHPDLRVAEVDILFPAGGSGEALRAALEEVFRRAAEAVRSGAALVILTDRKADAERAAIPALLAAAGLHHHLVREGLRTRAALVVETGEAREVMHFALLVGYGANAVCPYLALSTVRELAEEGLLDSRRTPEEAADTYITAVKKGLLKTFSRMGISTIRSYAGAQLFEAVGLSRELVDRYFTGTPSRVGGLGLDDVAAEVELRHRRAYPQRGAPRAQLEAGGAYRLRAGAERHLWTPESISCLQLAVRSGDAGQFRRFEEMIDPSGRPGLTLRSLLEFCPGEAVPLEEVEPVESLVRRFYSSAMSMGSLSPEAHETIALAMNRLGAGGSNSGEGGEDPGRAAPAPDGTGRSSRVRQVASGRFGVTADYLAGAEELQIKIAQGAKPGEGGQLPGQKVTAEIARVRHTTAGVTLISPPPHHDIYSIEDIAQLIHDLRCANPRARVSVKLVSAPGVGTVAAGVAKAGADMVLVSGYDGGTGASPLTSIRHAGLPWELGLAETQQVLVRNGLRDRVRLQVDGQLRTGRDLAVAALLGAEEFGFGTSVLVALGCLMMRKCHLNTCPVGVCTQDQRLRRRFAGRPEHVERLMRFTAESLRRQMAGLGFRRLDEMVGRVERLRAAAAPSPGRARGLDLRAILEPPARAAGLPPGGGELHCVRAPERREPELDRRLLELAAPALDERRPVEIALPVGNVDRTVGTRLSGEIVRRFGPPGLPEDSVRVSLSGSAGQSLGAFLAPGVSLRLEGDANDYLCKGMSGGRVVVVPPAGATFPAHENVIAGNTALYGATDGEVFLGGTAGERFAVRNSGARAVVEGVGDHACEYMTGGAVVVLGPTGVNFAAGMSGGVAYVYDESGIFDTRCNLDMVEIEAVWAEADRRELRAMVERHRELTGSRRAAAILDDWETACPLFVKVMPVDYRRALEKMRLDEHVEAETVSATEEVYGG